MLLFTGALTSKPYAFTARPWELRSAHSIDILDGVGSNTRIDFKENKIVRILPRRNLEINESWISDKARFFYDGLSRQRLTAPYMKEKGKLKKVKWSRILKSLTSVLKTYSFEFGASKVGLLLGSSCDSETFFTARDFAHSFGFANLGLDREARVMTDNPGDYSFKGEIHDLESVDFCLVVGSNPRYEASTLNLRLSKLFRRGQLQTASIGGNFPSTFAVDFLGLTSKTLVSFVEGKHSSCKSFAKAKNPMILYGSGLLERYDAEGLQNLFKILDSSFFSLFGKRLRANPLQRDSNLVGGLELGLRTVEKEDWRGLKLLYCIGGEKKGLFRSLQSQPSSPLLIAQDCVGSATTEVADFVLPSTTFVEKTSTFYNMEGRPQKVRRALVGPNLARDDWRIVRVLFAMMKKSCLYRTYPELVGEASKLLPSLACANFWSPKWKGSLASVLPPAVLRKEKIYISPFKLPIEDFYMTDKMCQSSLIMAKASHHLRSYSHNYKFLP